MDRKKKKRIKKGCKMKWKERKCHSENNNNVIYHLFREYQDGKEDTIMFLTFLLFFPIAIHFIFGSTKWINNNNNKTKEESIKDTHQTNKQTKQNLWLYLFHLVQKEVFKSILCVTNKQTNNPPFSCYVTTRNDNRLHNRIPYIPYTKAAVPLV